MGYTALLLAISRNYIEAVRILLEKKANIYAQNKVDRNILSDSIPSVLLFYVMHVVRECVCVC